ncbi:MAG TPA: aldo/keto reductase, partial [Vicinamibacteria bacterium]
DRLALYQLHAPDPRTPLLTSVRALEALRRAGVVEAVGLSNVSVAQIEAARSVTEIASVQVEVSPFAEESLRNGVAEYCAARGILVLAHRPLGGRKRRRQIEKDSVLSECAARLGATPSEVALAWLEDLSPWLLALPGPTSEESARSLGRARRLALSDDDRARLDAHFPAGRLLRVPRAMRRPAAPEPEVVIVMGLPGAGKTRIALDMVKQGYARLNRDEEGGRLKDLLPALDRTLASGRKRVVLDNTYASRAARNAVIEKAWAHGVDARCVFVKTSLEEAQVNAAQRILERHGRLLDPEELAQASRTDPGAFAPRVQMRYQRELEPPDPDEGFSRIDELVFVRERKPDAHGQALLLWLDGVVRGSRSGRRAPLAPDDVVLLPGRRETLGRYHAKGFSLLGLAWYPEVGQGEARAEDVEAVRRRTEEQIGAPLEALYCPHADGPPVCWCRKPLPGLGVVLMERHQLDPSRCLYVGADAGDEGLARRLGIEFREAGPFFAGA